MILKKISLKNFRQFRDVSVNFANDDNKNVTIILGQNGSGKTTFAQAFQWCLYGETSFSEKNVLNKKVADSLPGSNNSQIAEVKLELEHRGSHYRIIRTQSFSYKSSSQSVAGDTPTIRIFEIDSNGVEKQLKENINRQLFINEMLPKRLSKYFFFDGERMQKMSFDIQKGMKSSEFAQAVTNLLGLNFYKNACEHLKNGAAQSVTQKFQRNLAKNAGSKAEKLQESNESLATLIQANNERIRIIEEDEIPKYTRIQDDAADILLKNKESANKQAEREKYERRINEDQRRIYQEYEQAGKNFRRDFYSLLMKKIALDAVVVLSHHRASEEEIPHVKDSTIKHLLLRGKCLCGTDLVNNESARKNLEELLNFVPPKSIVGSVHGMITNIKSTYAGATCDDLSDEFEQILGKVADLDEEIKENHNLIEQIDRMLGGKDYEHVVNHANTTHLEAKNKIRDLITEVGRLQQDNCIQQKKIDENSAELQKLQLAIDNNRSIQLCLDYANKAYEKLHSQYAQREEGMRLRLENEVNKIFKKIYAGNISLNIDQNYCVLANVENSGVCELSTAQSYSVILSFISGILSIISSLKDEADDASLLLDSYPMVMDAPLSSFDKTRIQAICDTLPQLAKQIIIFTKDTDGDLANNYLADHIGQRLAFNKIDEFETNINQVLQ